MKRTAEGVLTIIGIVINFFMIGGALFFIALLNDPIARQEFELQFQSDPALAEAGFTPQQLFDLIDGLGAAFNIVVVISIILSFVALFAMRRNKKPKLAGSLLIASALLVGVATLLLGWLPALLFLIAGIMCFARKPKVVEQTTVYQEDDQMRPL
ncbi:DUF4064 domain-containing protein [Jeotgalibacillus sp. R-1-5s-1]|uniref:DUF4064 domain-containing protein n=1 Tax=Jeotgalibacillus sp. R-1-5s-1 TaxID=2555897 RepID=UPI00106D831B|nr:DUF4064 domain-containing protein [Jeotgalibacillus sp. R-1-5s-1]TFE02494.1 DUF4064 domain-containing protein [Jeotgalibacillus sp. R-1-5s-1]